MNNKTMPVTPDAQALVQEPVQALIQSLAKQHIRLKLSDTGELAVRGEKANLTPALIEQIKQHKAALISWLQAQQAGVGDDLQAMSASAEPIPVQPQRDGLLPLSHAQQRLWLLDRMLGSNLNHSPQYNMSAAFTLRGDLNQSALQQALDHIVCRHEILRTRYVEAQDAAGEGRQVIDATASVPVRKHALDELAIETVSEEHVNEEAISKEAATKITDFLQQCAHQPFNLAEQHPVRCDLLTVQADHHILLFTMHHIASDEWSLNVVTQEFATLYQAICASGSNQGQNQEQSQDHNKSESWQHSLPVLDCQYLDYTLWQQASLKAANEAESVKSPMQFWQETLANAPALHSLPSDFRRPAAQDGKGDIVQSELSPELSQNLRKLAKRCGVTPFVLLHSTFALLIAKWSDSPVNSESQTKISDIVIGTPVAGRDHKSLQALIGFFVNTLALRTRVDEQLSFQDFLAQNKTDIMAAFSHQQVPFDAVVEALSVDVSQRYSPLVQIMFTALDGNREALNLAGLEIADFPLPLQTSKFDISVALLDDTSGNVGLVWNYATALFSRRTIENMQQSWEVLLRQIVAAPQGKLRDLSLLEMNQEALVNKNRETEAQRYNGSIDQLVYEQASLVPEQVAVVDCAPRTPDEKQLTYRELTQRADKLAAQLLKAQTTVSSPNPPVALLVERSIDMVVAMLGIVRAGMCYVPLAADNPPSRSAAILADCGAQIMVSHRGLAADLQQQLIQAPTQELSKTDNTFPQQIINLDELSTQDESSAPAPELTPEPAHEKDRLAYIIYTSGSTGKPKGVMIKQHSIVNLVYRNAFFTPSDNEVLGQCANHAFDAATFEVWGALANGKCTAIVSKQQLLDTREFARMIREYRISTLFLTTAYLNQISHDLAANDLPEKQKDEEQTGVDLSQLNNLYFGGEAADINAVNRVFDHMSGHGSKGSNQILGSRILGERRLVHVYGPTETTTFSSWHLITAPCVDNCPIGKPLTAHQHLVLDSNQKPVPDGVVGELYIGGLGVSAGYLNNPTLTANAFTGFLETEHRTLDNSLYRTGDKVKRDHQGNLVFMHRADSQVKLRGFRIELEEIVAHLSRIDGVDDAYVQIEQGQIEQGQIEKDKQAKQKLVAYLAGEQAVASPEALIQTCQRTLATQLPEYMLPSEYGCCRAFVLNANGKIDQQALPDYYAMPVSEGRVAPRNEVEQNLTDMWQELLEIDAQQFGVTDNFFELGAHSLTAVKLEFSVRETYGNALSVEDIFNYPSIEELAKIITDADQSSNVLESIPVADRSQSLPLSYGQRRLWFVDQIQGQSPEYNMPNALRFKGELNVDAMQAALNALLQRHESLRTCFTLTDEQPVCHIQQVAELPLQRHDLSEIAAENPAQAEQQAAQLLTELAREPFDLAKDIMLKVALIVLAPQDHILLFNQHHIASDGWSVDVMTRELMSLYQLQESQQQASKEISTDELPELPVQYADFALWQHQQLQSNSLTSRITEQLNYWREQLADAPAVHHLPLDFMRPREQSFVGNNHLVALSPEQSQGLRELANQLDVTLFTLLQSIFALLVAKWSGENDVLIGTPVAGRDHPELESVIGFFVNNLVLRSQINPNTPLREYIAASKTMVMDAFSHQHVPFDMLVEELNPERSLSHSPLYQIGFLLNPADRQLFSLPSLEIEGMEIGESTCKFDLNLIAIEDKSHISLLWEYAASLFTPNTIANMAHSFALLVKQIVANPSQTLGELALTDHTALQQFCTWHGKPYVAPAQPLLHQQFSAQARRTPEAIVASVAINELSVSNDQELQYQQLQYQELEALSNRVAQQLRQHIHQPDTCVILLVERDVNMLIGMLGILKAGGAYVPLDTDMPASRMRDIVEDCGASLVLCDDIDKSRQGLNNELGNSLHFIDINQAQTAAYSQEQQIPEQTDHSLAYVIYTSGSTGKPKGVMVSHRNVMRLVKDNAFVPFNASDVVAQVSNHSFDAATFEVWGALVNGSRLQFIDKPTLLDPIALSNALVAHGISIMFITASLFNQLVFADQHGYESLRYLLVGGEAIDVNSVNQMLAQHRPAHLLNAYGPTENTTFSLTHDIQTQRSDYYPIGKSIGGNTHYVLDANLNLLPPGVVGELYLGGDGVARGYLNNPALTAKAFIANPFASEQVKNITGDASPYLYKTGDRVFYNADGEVIYIGRADHQVKLRGYRIELTEIQQVLREYHAIDDAFVTVCGEGLQRHIVAYVTLPEQSSSSESVSEPDPQLDQQSCYDYLRSRLPDYMVPQTLMPLAAFPLNANGKFDRKALPEPAFAALATDTATGPATKTAPQTPTEQQLHTLWCGLFVAAEQKESQEEKHGESIGTEDNFFALGGHSIMATRLVADINRTFGTALNIRIIFENQTIATQARLIDTTLAEQPDQQGVRIEQRFASDAAVEEMEL